MFPSDDNESVLDTLLSLESALIELRTQYADFTHASSKNLPTRGATAVAGICRAGKTIASATSRLKQYTTDADRVAGRVDIRSVHELALRAVVLFATDRLTRLHALIAQSPQRAHRLFIGRLRTMDDVTAWVLDGFADLSVGWTAPKVPGDPVPEPSGSAHHRVLRSARARVIAMANEPEFRHFLSAGIHAYDWPELGRACAELDAVLRLDMEAPPWAFRVADGSRRISTDEQAPVAAAASTPD